jgi:hypothetical protein
VEYAAVRDRDVLIPKMLGGEFCCRCKRTYLWGHLPGLQEGLAEKAPAGFRIMQETGIYTNTFLEVLAGTSGQLETDVQLTHRSNGIRLRFGPQSTFFKEALDLVTDYDTSDYGHDLERTVRINPGPPYNVEQRRTITRLLARIRTATQAPIDFWTVHFFAISPEEQEGIDTELLEKLLDWKLDGDRRALSLACTTLNRVHPGALINSFRLLELVIERLVQSIFARKRWDTNTTDRDLLSIVRKSGENLGSKIKMAVGLLPPQETGVLMDLWRVTVPERRFNKEEVASQIVKFRNIHVHGPTAEAPSKELQLPWELPPYDLIAYRVLRLVLCLIRVGQ